MSFIDKDSREKRAGIVSEARALLDSPNLTAEDHAKFDAMMVEADALETLAKKREQVAAMEAEMSQVIGARAETRGRSFNEQADIAANRKAGFLAMMKGEMLGTDTKLNAHERDLATRYRAAQGVSSGGAGGYTVDTVLQHELLAALKAIGDGVRSVARTVATTTGGPLNFPLIDDTANTGSIVSENSSVGTSTDLVFTQAAMSAYKISTGVQPVSTELLQDSAFDIEQWVHDLFVLRLARTTNAYYTTGTGSSQPQGVVVGSTLGKTAASGQTASVIIDDAYDLFHSVDPAYRPDAVWMMNDSMIKLWRKLKDSTGLPIWNPSLVTGQPDTLLNRPIVLNQAMANAAASAKSVLFGSFRNYLIRDVLDMQFVTFREKYLDSGQIGFLMNMRTDGKLISAGAPIKHLVQAAS